MDLIIDNIKKCQERATKNLINYNGPINYNLDLSLEKNNSLFLNELSNIKIFVNNKINHIICRKCKNCEIYIFDNLISGIDILYSENIKITGRLFYTFGLEYNEKINISGNIDLLKIIGSQEITLNNYKLPITVFSSLNYSNNIF